MARALKFRFREVEGLFYLCSGNKGADQLRGYPVADLAASLFSHMPNLGFHMTRFIY